jgi:hypothetical protein
MVAAPEIGILMCTRDEIFSLGSMREGKFKWENSSLAHNNFFIPKLNELLGGLCTRNSSQSTKTSKNSVYSHFFCPHTIKLTASFLVETDEINYHVLIRSHCLQCASFVNSRVPDTQLQNDQNFGSDCASQIVSSSTVPSSIVPSSIDPSQTAAAQNLQIDPEMSCGDQQLYDLAQQLNSAATNVLFGYVGKILATKEGDKKKQLAEKLDDIIFTIGLKFKEILNENDSSLSELPLEEIHRFELPLEDIYRFELSPGNSCTVSIDPSILKAISSIETRSGSPKEVATPRLHNSTDALPEVTNVFENLPVVMQNESSPKRLSDEFEESSPSKRIKTILTSKLTRSRRPSTHYGVKFAKSGALLSSSARTCATSVPSSAATSVPELKKVDQDTGERVQLAGFHGKSDSVAAQVLAEIEMKNSGKLTCTSNNPIFEFKLSPFWF